VHAPVSKNIPFEDFEEREAWEARAALAMAVPRQYSMGGRGR